MSPSWNDDATSRPDLFRWNGPLDKEGLEAWLAERRWLGRIPQDLLAFWQQTGGGDVFETETILGPRGDPHKGDDIVSVNQYMSSSGMQSRFIVFHIGMLTTAVDTEVGDYVELDASTFGVLRRFGSLEDWYQATLKKEYGQRYGLEMAAL